MEEMKVSLRLLETLFVRMHRIIWILQMAEGLTGAKKKIRSVLQKF